MIEHIRTIGFKGQDIDEDVPQKVLYVGRNRSGKSTRAAAIALALYGHIPFLLTKKLPGDIFRAYASGETMAVAVTIGGVEFGRKIKPNGKGGYSQSVQIDKKGTSAEKFAVKLSEVGSPKISDIAQFMKDSDSKKIDTLFELFPNDELKNIDSEIEQAKDDVSHYTSEKTKAEGVISRLNQSKTQIQLPAGNIAETQAEIKSVEAQIKDVQEQIKQAEIEQARIESEEKGKEKGKKEAEQNALNRMEATRQSKTDDSDFYGETPDFSTSIDLTQQPPPGIDADNIMINKDQWPKDLGEQIQEGAIVSIKRIIGALTGSGCETCAALIVAKQELKKYV
jgi:hypothetical protein